MHYRPKKFSLPEGGIWPGDADCLPYVFNDDIVISVDVALAADRPLLVSGPPGSGKSMLAPTMARITRRRFLKHTLTSRSRLEDLTGHVDQLERLHDAHATALKPDWRYMEPGLLWWAFDPDSAANRGATPEQIQELEGATNQPFLRLESPDPSGEGGDVVVLLDEIDKAEPDLPNDLLEPLDLGRFQVPNGPGIEAPKDLAMLTIITTNGERDLPPAFLRRCVILRLEHPTAKELWTIGEQHYPAVPVGLRQSLASKVVGLRDQAIAEGRRPPSTSEYLDALRACNELSIQIDSKLWKHVEQAALIKNIDSDEDQ